MTLIELSKWVSSYFTHLHCHVCWICMKHHFSRMLQCKTQLKILHDFFYSNFFQCYQPFCSAFTTSWHKSNHKINNQRTGKVFILCTVWVCKCVFVLKWWSLGICRHAADTKPQFLTLQRKQSKCLQWFYMNKRKALRRAQCIMGWFQTELF